MGNVYIPPWATPLADDSTFGMENVLSEGPASIKLDGKSHVILGRSSTDANVTLSSPTASRVHALLVANGEDGLVYIIDLKSAHGTHIEGEKLVAHKANALRIGQEVRFGAHDGGARYKVMAAPSRKRPAEDKLGDDKVSKRKIPEGKVRCSHVLIKHKGSRKTHSKRDPDGLEIMERSKEQASTLLVQFSKDFTNGEITFEELARKVSDCSSGSKGGDLGFFDYSKMQQPFSEAAFNLKIDELSGPVETDSGVHIILRTA